MFDGLSAVFNQLHKPIFDEKYTADQAIVKATLLHRPRSNGLTVIFLPWHVPEWYIKRLQAKISVKHSSVLTYVFNPGIIEADIIQAKNSFEFIALSVASDVDVLARTHHSTKINLVGISLGNVSLCMTAEQLTHFDDVVMIVPGDTLADPLWYGWRTRRLRNRLAAQGVTLNELEKEWDDLAPHVHIETFKGHRVHIILGEKDRFIPYKYGKRLAEELQAVNPNVVFTKKPVGHLATILAYQLEHMDT